MLSSYFKFWVRIAVLLFITGCSKKHEAPAPTYLALPSLELKTDLPSEGTASNAITTAWIFDGNEGLGVYELPATFPAALAEGGHDFIIYPGVNLNGIQSVRAIYDAFQPIRVSREIKNPGTLDTIQFSINERTTEYNPNYQINIVENFEQSGLNFQGTSRSDTTMTKSKDPDSIFSYQPPNANEPEENSAVGFFEVSSDRPEGSFTSVTTYSLPRGLQNLYLELNYRTTVPLEIGLGAILPNGPQRAPSVELFPQKEWNKLHLDLITEYQGFQNASGFKVFLRARLPEGTTTGRVFLDNIKLIFRQ